MRFKIPSRAEIFKFLKKLPKILWQMLVELALPLLFATGVVGYRYLTTSNIKHSNFHWSDDFGAKLFFFGWLFAQFFRIAKQQGNDERLSEINLTANALLSSLEVKTQAIIDKMTGGDSLARFLFAAFGEQIMVVANVKGKHALLDVQVEVFALSGFEYAPERDGYTMSGGSRVYKEHFSALHPGQQYRMPQTIAADKDELLFLVDCNARNRAWKQFIALKRFPDWRGGWGYRSWTFAPPDRGAIYEESIPPGTPPWPTKGSLPDIVVTTSRIAPAR